MVLVFFTDPVSLKTLAEIYEHIFKINLVNVNKFLPLERAFYLLSNCINNLA